MASGECRRLTETLGWYRRSLCPDRFRSIAGARKKGSSIPSTTPSTAVTMCMAVSPGTSTRLETAGGFRCTSSSARSTDTSTRITPGTRLAADQMSTGIFREKSVVSTGLRRLLRPCWFASHRDRFQDRAIRSLRSGVGRLDSSSTSTHANAANQMID